LYPTGAKDDEELAYRQAGTGGKPVPTLAENDQAFIKKLF